MTNRQLYTYRNILEYVNGEYVLTNPITDQNIKEMRNNMEETDVEDFDRFIEKHWSSKKQTVPVSANVEETSKRRGRRKKEEV